MNIIYKYKLELKPCAEIIIPINSQILTVGIQNGEIFIWVKVDRDEKLKIRKKFFILGTGELLPYEHTVFVGTVFMDIWVYHIFEGNVTFIDEEEKDFRKPTQLY